MLVDSSGKLVLANRAFREVFGEALPPLEDDVGNALPESANPVPLAVRSDRFVQPFTAAPGGRFAEVVRGVRPVDPARECQWRSPSLFATFRERSLRQLQEEFIALASHELRHAADRAERLARTCCAATWMWTATHA